MIFSAFKPYALVVTISVVIAGIVGSAWAGYQHGSKVVQARWDSTVLAQKEGQEAALKAAAQAIAKIEVKSEKHIHPVRTEIRTNTVYRECRHSPDSVRNLNSLITGDELPRGDGVPSANPAR